MAASTPPESHGDYSYAVVDAADVRNMGNGTYEIRITGVVTRAAVPPDPGNPAAGEGRGEQRREFDTFGLLCPRCRHIVSLVTGWLVLLRRGAVEEDHSVPPCA